MPGFVNYILKHKHWDSAWGDVAMDFAHEQCEVQRNWGYKKIKAHLEEKGACDRVMCIFEEMWEGYKASKGSMDAQWRFAQKPKDTRRV
jgi:uncharacterized protein YozE (UPF0346 family)